MTLRQLLDDDRREAALQARAWGFRRPISWQEYSEGVWVITEARDAIAWFVKGPIEEGHFLLHAMRAPEKSTGLRARLPSGEMLAALRTVASLAGATRLYAGLAHSRPGWRRFLRKSGYFEGEDAVGPYMILESLGAPDS